MPIERIQPDGLAKPPTYSHVVKAGNTVYVAGQTSQNERGELVGRGDITAQAEQVYQNIQKALASVGADFSNVVKATVFITDARFREPVSEVRARYLAGNLPASTLLVVAGLASPDMLLEVEVIAVLD
jgi:enamine deaminase RidA (YjgF/YER057c/UK114 family)